MRLAVALGFALVVNIVLFFLMGRLTDTSGLTAAKAGTRSAPIEFVRLKREPPPAPPPLRQPPPEKAEPPTPTPLTPSIAIPLRHSMPVMNQVTLDIPLRLGAGPYLGGFRPNLAAFAGYAPESGITPLVRIGPEYPRRAQLTGIEGYVEVEFTINPDGTVSDPKIRKAKPMGIFDRAVLHAIKRWKFTPQIVDGEAVARRATQTIRFKLDNS